VAADGSHAPLDWDRVRTLVTDACAGLTGVDPEPVLAGIGTTVYDGIPARELGLAPILATRALVRPNRTTPPWPPGCSATCCAPRR
jgi:ribonucleoside-diphosphate reductase alpha chain